LHFVFAVLHVGIAMVLIFKR